MSQGQRRLYIVGVLLWMSFGLLFPVWVGRSYSGGGQPRRSGSFALQGGRGFGKRAPIWSPPRRASGFTSVRWPWQAPRGGNHVEISIARLCAFWTVGILVLGFVVGGVSWISHPKKPDPFLATVWSISTSLVLGWICIFVLAALSMGYAATEPVIIGVLFFSALAGLAYGLGARCRRRERAREASKSQELAKQTSALSSQGDPNNAVHQVGKRILLFVLGVAAGLGMWLAARRVSNFFKSSDIDLATGFFTLGAGLVLGIFLFRIYRYRAFVHGLCLATTVVGLTCVRLPGIWLVPIWVLVVLAVQWKRASFRLQLWQFLVGAICLALLLALPGRVLFFHWNMRRTMQRSRQNVDQIVERYIGAASAENEPEVQKIRQQILQLEMDDSRAFSYLFLKLNVLLPKVPEPARAEILQFLSSEALARNERGSPSDYAQRMAIIARDVNQPLAIRCEALKVLLNWSVLSEVADAMMVLPEDEKDQFEPVVYEFFDQRRGDLDLSVSEAEKFVPVLPQLMSSPDRIVAVLIVILDNIPDHGQLPREVAHMLGKYGAAARPALQLESVELLLRSSRWSNVVEIMTELSESEKLQIEPTISEFLVQLELPQLIRNAEKFVPLLPQLISSPDRIVPVLITILDRIGEWDPLTSEVARMLGEQGAAARPALPQLRRVTASANDKLRQAAEQAIKEIQSDVPATFR